MSDEELSTLDVTDIAEDADNGYILEVDLEYPDSLHEDHSDYPLAPGRRPINKKQLTPYSQQLIDELGMKGKPTEKLVPTLHDKTKYVLHYRNLKQYMSLGLRLTKIHRAIGFHQSKWLQPYIDFNTEMWKATKNTFENDFCKLMNNSVFGKTMENMRKRINVKLCSNERQFKRQVVKLESRRFKMFNEDLVGVHLQVSNLVLNKPIYVGTSILDLSQTLMYDFHYNHIQSKYRKAKLLFTDTQCDSLCYHIETKDIHGDMSLDDLSDNSKYPTDHMCHSDKNKKVLGKMKDKTAGVPMMEIAGLRSKMYNMVYEDKEKKTAKGIGRASLREMKHAEYVQCLLDKCSTIAQFNIIRSYAHQVYSERVTKVALSPFDDKRYVLEDEVTTLAHGHSRIQY